MEITIKFNTDTEVTATEVDKERMKKKLVDLIDTRICKYYESIFGEERAEISRSTLTDYVNDQIKVEHIEKLGETEEEKYLVKISFHPADYIKLTLLPSRSILAPIDDELWLILTTGAFLGSGIAGFFSFSLNVCRYFSIGPVLSPSMFLLFYCISPTIGAAFGGHLLASIFGIRSHVPYGIDLAAAGAATAVGFAFDVPLMSLGLRLFSPFFAFFGGFYTVNGIIEHAEALYKASKRKDECSVLNVIPYLPRIEGNVSTRPEDDNFTATIKMDLSN